MKIGYIRNIILLMSPFYLVLILTQGFFAKEFLIARTGQSALTPFLAIPEHWWLVGGAVMSIEGIEYALNVVFKTITLTLVLPLGIFTTDINAMIIGMVKARIPYKIAFIISSTLRFFPLLFDEIRSIIDAQRLRGLAIEDMGPVKRIRVYARIAVPLILGVLIKSQKLEVVLQSKGFTGHPDRTYLHQSKLHTNDYILVILFGFIFVAALVLYFTLDIGRFNGPI